MTEFYRKPEAAIFISLVFLALRTAPVAKRQELEMVRSAGF